jgi:hypothetical protein
MSTSESSLVAEEIRPHKGCEDVEEDYGGD